ncbi:hypothetical protein ACCS79_00865 [Rhizobium johnstonii]
MDNDSSRSTIALISSAFPKPLMTMLSPVSAKAVAIARPMPLVEPVTTTVLLMLFSLKSRCCVAALAAKLCPKPAGWQFCFIRFSRPHPCPIDLSRQLTC